MPRLLSSSNSDLHCSELLAQGLVSGRRQCDCSGMGPGPAKIVSTEIADSWTSSASPATRTRGSPPRCSRRGRDRQDLADALAPRLREAKRAGGGLDVCDLEAEGLEADQTRDHHVEDGSAPRFSPSRGAPPALDRRTCSRSRQSRGRARVAHRPVAGPPPAASRASDVASEFADSRKSRSRWSEPPWPRRLWDQWPWSLWVL